MISVTTFFTEPKIINKIIEVEEDWKLLSKISYYINNSFYFDLIKNSKKYKIENFENIVFSFDCLNKNEISEVKPYKSRKSNYIKHYKTIDFNLIKDDIYKQFVINVLKLIVEHYDIDKLLNYEIDFKNITKIIISS